MHGTPAGKVRPRERGDSGGRNDCDERRAGQGREEEEGDRPDGDGAGDELTGRDGDAGGVW